MAIWRPEKKIHNGKSFTECKTISLWSGIRTSWKWNIWWVWIKSLQLRTAHKAFHASWHLVLLEFGSGFNPSDTKSVLFCDNPIVLLWLFLGTLVTKLPRLQPCEPNSQSFTNWTTRLTLQCDLTQAHGMFLIWFTL